MTRSPRPFLALCFLAFVLGAMEIDSLRARAASPADAIPQGQRTDAFRRLLHVLGFQPIGNFAALKAHPGESLLVVLGDPSCLSEAFAAGELRSFVESGGAVLIATDKPTLGPAGAQLSRLAGVTVTGEMLVCAPVKPDDIYFGEPCCPFVLPFADAMGSKAASNVLGLLTSLAGVGNRPSLFRSPQPERGELRRVASNAPSRLQINSSSWWLPSGIFRLAELPNHCLEASSTLQRSTFPSPPAFRIGAPVKPKQITSPLFAVGGAVGKGRALVLADHSLFINRMILPSDTDNLEFAANCLHWLRGGASTPTEALRALNESKNLQSLTGQRTKVLFWDDGRVRSDFNVPLVRVPVKPTMAMEPAIVAAVDKTIANLEEKDAFNRALLDRLDDWAGGRHRLPRYVVYVLTFAMCLLLGYRFLWRGRYRGDFAVPTPVDGVEPRRTNLSFLDQRRRSLLRSGNFWETAHLLAREFFDSVGFSPRGSSPPHARIVEGGWRRRWRLRRLCARWWRLARGDAPVVVSPKSLRRWLRELDELKSAAANGTLRLT